MAAAFFLQAYPSLFLGCSRYLREIIIMSKLDNQTIQLVLIALVALAMLVQAFVLLAAFIAMRKAARSIDDKLEAFRSSVTPLIDNTRALVARLTPRIEETADDLAALTHSLRVQAADIQFAANEIVARARIQATRLDGILTHVLDTLQRTGNFVTDAVSKPVRQFSAILASVKAVVESLRTGAPAPRSQANRESTDQDMFV
jgi:septal ring factor EnvC (AmiA/AmiB activator)